MRVNPPGGDCCVREVSRPPPLPVSTGGTVAVGRGRRRCDRRRLHRRRLLLRDRRGLGRRGAALGVADEDLGAGRESGGCLRHAQVQRHREGAAAAGRADRLDRLRHRQRADARQVDDVVRRRVDGDAADAEPGHPGADARLGVAVLRIGAGGDAQRGGADQTAEQRHGTRGDGRVRRRLGARCCSLDHRRRAGDAHRRTVAEREIAAARGRPGARAQRCPGRPGRRPAGSPG